jgi:regulator of protease activity HflC (stomatin/prohibitin superfamily)
VAGGKIQTLNPPAGNLARFGGPGVLIVQEGHAVVLERGGRRSRIVGTGVWFLAMFERINTIIPLTQRAVPIEVTDVITEDRVVISKIKLLAFTRLDTGDSSHENGDYPFDEKIINDLVWSPKAEEIFDWAGAVTNIAGTALRDLVARLQLDDLVIPTNEALKLRSVLKDAINRVTRDTFGVIVSGIVFDEIVISDEAKAELRSRRLANVSKYQFSSVGTKVFLVHGHDDNVKEAVARFLMQLVV